jgi:hypothetical protein
MVRSSTEYALPLQGRLQLCLACVDENGTFMQHESVPADSKRIVSDELCFGMASGSTTASAMCIARAQGCAQIGSNDQGSPPLTIQMKY